MADELAYDEEPTEAGGIGAQLKAAREARGLTLEQVAAETRIPQRHLLTIEAGAFSALPARTYAIGFARTYAKAVGLDDTDVADMVRAELDAQETGPRHRVAGFEPGDPARVPSRALGWLSVLAVVLVLAGLFFAARTFFAPGAELPTLIEQEEAELATETAVERPAATAANASGPVVFTALDEAWVRFYTPEVDDLPGNEYLTRFGRFDLTGPTHVVRPVAEQAMEIGLRLRVGPASTFFDRGLG